MTLDRDSVGMQHLKGRVEANKIRCWALLILIALPNVLQAALPCIDAPKKVFASQNTVVVDSVASLQSAVEDLVNDTTILIKAGNYSLTKTLYVTESGTVIRSESGRCDDVTLIGRGMENANYGEVGSGIWVRANNVTVANLTIVTCTFIRLS